MPAEQSSVPTHGSEQCLSACRYMAVLLAALMHGEPLDEVLSPSWSGLERLRAEADLGLALLMSGRESAGIETLEKVEQEFAATGNLAEAQLSDRLSSVHR